MAAIPALGVNAILSSPADVVHQKQKCLLRLKRNVWVLAETMTVVDATTVVFLELDRIRIPSIESRFRHQSQTLLHRRVFSAIARKVG
jgi:hypothetical protein